MATIHPLLVSALIVFGTVAVFSVSERAASALGLTRPTLSAIMVTTALLAAVGLIMSPAQSIGTSPAQRTNAFLPRMLVVVVWGGTLAGCIAAASSALKQKSVTARLLGMTVAGMGGVIIGAIGGLVASCFVGVGCI